MIGAPGQRIPNPKLENYDVFVQSMGIGYRPLEADSRILYDHEVHAHQFLSTIANLYCIDII